LSTFRAPETQWKVSGSTLRALLYAVARPRGASQQIRAYSAQMHHERKNPPRLPRDVAAASTVAKS